MPRRLTHGACGSADSVGRDTVLVSPVLPQRVRHFALALEESGRLDTLVTSYAHNPRGALERLIAAVDGATGGCLAGLLRRRSIEEVPPDRLQHDAAAACLAYLLERLPWSSAGLIGREDRLFRSVDDLAARSAIRQGTAAVLGREDGCLASFLRARRVGARCFYDLPTAHHATVREVLEQEEQAFPGVCQMPGWRVIFTPKRVEHKEAELAAADHVLVGSPFVRRSLTGHGYPPHRITVIPSACEPAWLPARACLPAGGPSRVVLHVGRLSLRKGTHRLLRAWKRLGAHRTHRLRLVGEMWLSRRFLADFSGIYEHAGPLPRAKLRGEYRSACLFVLPAAAEGFAAVILEALSSGLPVVASRSSGADGFLTPGLHGLLHEFGNDEELTAQLDWMLSHPRERSEMARQVRLKAAGWTWRDYRAQFLQVLEGPCAVSSAA